MNNTASSSFQRYEDKKRALGTDMLSAALDLHERGLVVIPLKPRSEEPFLSWKELQGKQANGRTDQGLVRSRARDKYWHHNGRFIRHCGSGC
jgi:hypothetical protein